jgi:hypothetical protein
MVWNMLCYGHYKTKGAFTMFKWLCYDDDTDFYIEAATREDAEAFAELHEGHVVCVMPAANQTTVEHPAEPQQ